MVGGQPRGSYIPNTRALLHETCGRHNALARALNGGGLATAHSSEGVFSPMQRTTVKQTVLAFMLASLLPLAACGKSDTPTSPTQPGPPVSETPPPAPPAPEPPPEPEPPIVDDRPVVSITGPVVNLTRGGEGDLDISFRIDDFTIVKATADTPVVAGSETGRTDFVRNGQTVIAQGRRSNGFLEATRIEIIAQAPE
jgi:hypothetical protein